MFVRHHARLRALAAAGVLALTAGSATVLATAAPSTAAASSYSCTIPTVLPGIGVQPLSIFSAGSVPSTLPTGSSVVPTYSPGLVIPSTIADLIRTLLGADQLNGVIHSTVLVNGVEQVVDTIVPLTSLGGAGTAIPLGGTSSFAPITAGLPGTVNLLSAGDQDVSLSLINNLTHTVTPFDVPCVLTPGQNTSFATVVSVKDGSTTAARASFNKRLHKVRSSATVRSAHGIVKPAGSVRFTLKRGTHRVAVMTRSLNSSGVAVAVFKHVRRTGAYRVVATYAGSSLLKGSRGSARFRVR